MHISDAKLASCSQHIPVNTAIRPLTASIDCQHRHLALFSDALKLKYANKNWVNLREYRPDFTQPFISKRSRFERWICAWGSPYRRLARYRRITNPTALQFAQIPKVLARNTNLFETNPVPLHSEQIPKVLARNTKISQQNSKRVRSQ